MSLRLFDSGCRAVRPFEPLVPGVVTMYVCGPTVQAPPHVGHVRSAVVFDILRRWLTASGSDVVLARNVTDIDDKILAEAARTGQPWWAVAERNARAFDAAYDAVGVLAPAVEPRATGHVPQMVTLMQRLFARGHAYASGGDVYFDVRSYPRYGSLSGQRPDEMVSEPAGEDGGPAAKRDPVDFALWKRAKPGEPSWETPWGPGRPGWHLECSAMAGAYFGATFDIHGGGLDLLFPHHENELAQSAAAGDGFARYWMHHGLVNVGGAKMSKSLGNSTLMSDVLGRVGAPALRYALGAAHYRSELTWGPDVLAEAEAAYGRLETFVRNASELVGAVSVPPPQPAGPAWAEFAAAMDDDVAVPRALGVVHAAVREGNTAMAAGDRATLGRALASVRGMLGVLGLDPVGQWSAAAAGGERLRPVVDALVSLALETRQSARGRGDFAAADGVRDALAAAGVLVEDTPDGTRWRLA